MCAPLQQRTLGHYVLEKKENAEDHHEIYISSIQFFIVLLLASWLKVVILPTLMEQVEKVSMERSLKMKTSRFHILSHSCFQWLMLVRTPMEVNSLSLLPRRHT